jgi:hypothetical protein
MKIKLESGQAYKMLVPVHVQLAAGPVERRRVSFRLGFGEGPYYGTSKTQPKSSTIWSNVVTVIVNR